VVYDVVHLVTQPQIDLTMTEGHSLIPPQQFVDKWVAMFEHCDDIDVLTEVAQWGADQELEACCEWLEDFNCSKRFTAELRAARRPKPLSLKDQSIALIDKIQSNKEMWDIRDLDVIRRALDSLPE